MDHLRKAIETEKLYLTLGGFYPAKLHFCWQILYILSCTFNTTISWMQFLLTITFMFTQLSNLVKVSEVLLFSCTQFAFICKLMNFIWHKQELVKLEGFLLNIRFNYLTPEQEKILNSYVNEIKHLAKIYRILCFAVVLFYGLFPYLDMDENGNKKLPLPMWFPFNPYHYYNAIHVMSILSIAVGAWTNSNIDVLNIMMITLGTAQIEILKDKFKNIIANPNTHEVLDEVSIQSSLRECVIHFNDIGR